MRAKAIAERAVIESSLEHTVFAPSLVYSPSDPYLTLLARMSWLPVMPIPGSGEAPFEPIWADDVARCVLAALDSETAGERYELAGPEILTQREIVETVLLSLRRPRPVVGIPTAVTRRLLKLVELFGGPTAFATWDEARAAAGAVAVEPRDGRRRAPRRHAGADRRGARDRLSLGTKRTV